MKKLKINEKIGKKFVLCTLIGTVSGFTLIGCNKESKFLEGTILEEAVVVSFEDGTKEVASRIKFCEDCDGKHMLYQDLVSKEYFTDDECAYEIKGVWGTDHYISKYAISGVEGIRKYLTDEEMKKAGNEGLNKEEISDIIVKINSTKPEEDKKLIK